MGRLTALILLLPLTLPAAWAWPPQPDDAMVERCKVRLEILFGISKMTDEDIATNMSLYFGQDIDARLDTSDSSRTDFYIVRRDPRTLAITFMARLGGRPRSAP